MHNTKGFYADMPEQIPNFPPFLLRQETCTLISLEDEVIFISYLLNNLYISSFRYFDGYIRFIYIIGNHLAPHHQLIPPYIIISS